MAQPASPLDPPPNPLQPQWIPRVEQGSERERVFGLVYQQMTTLAGGSRDLEDLVQSAAEQALRSLERFDGRSELSTWTYRICLNTYLKQRRFYYRWFKRFSYWEDLGREEPMAHGPNAMQSLARDEKQARLWAALGRISAKRRVVVVLHDLEELSIDQIAEIVSTNPLTVRSRLRDGRKMLARELADDPYFGVAAVQQEEP